MDIEGRYHWDIIGRYQLDIQEQLDIEGRYLEEHSADPERRGVKLDSLCQTAIQRERKRESECVRVCVCVCERQTVHLEQDGADPERRGVKLDVERLLHHVQCLCQQRGCLVQV